MMMSFSLLDFFSAQLKDLKERKRKSVLNLNMITLLGTLPS